MFGFLSPHLRVKSVLDLSLDRLRELGLDALLLDVDCTLKRYSHERCGEEVTDWLDQLRGAGIGLCLVSNGRGPRIRAFAEHYELPFAATAMKPLPFRIRRTVRRRGFDRKRTAMVGDQLFADIMAGRLAGLFTILVEPIHPEEEPWFTQLKRRPERRLLRRLDKKAAASGS